MANLFLELDESLRYDRLERLWKEYGSYLILFVVLAIAGTAMLAGYRAWNESVRLHNTDVLMMALESSDFPANIAKDKQLHGAGRGIALIQAAAHMIHQKKTAEAAQLIAEGARDTSIGGEIRDLLIIMNARNDSGEDARTMLDAVAKNRHSVWRFHAGLEAASYAAKGGDAARAQDYLDRIISDKDAPAGFAVQAKALKALYGGAEAQNAPH